MGHVQAAGAWFAWEQEGEASGFGLPGSSVEVSGTSDCTQPGLLPQHSPILGCTPPSSGFRKCRGREAGRACFPSVLSVCVHLEGRAGLQCALWESGAQEGHPGQWKTQDCHGDQPEERGRLALSREGTGREGVCSDLLQESLVCSLWPRGRASRSGQA